MAINFRGYLFDDAGSAIQGATVQLLEQDGDEEATTTTSATGLWYFNEADQDKYDIKITRGSSIRYIQWDDQISLKEIDVRNDTDENTPAATFTNLEDNASNQVAVFSGANATRADNDEIYLSFKLANSAGDIEEFARMTAVATDVTDGSEDAQIEFDVRKSGTLTKVWTITSSDGAMSFDMNIDSLTIGSGANTDISLTFDATTYDGVITWMEDEDYFQFSDDILMNSTEKIEFGDTATFIHQSADGVMTVDGEVTIDLNASTAVLVSNDLKLNSDSAVLGFGVDNDATLTHTDGTGLTLNSTNKLTFGDAASFIQQSSDGTLRIDGEAIIDLNASTRVDVSGDLKVGGEVQTASIGYTDGDNAITIADGGLITAAAGITSTAASNTLGATSFNDASITNVNDIALDSISADGTDINIAISDNSATALTIKQGSDAYLIVDTANSSESVSIGTGISGTAITIGHGTSETTVADNLTVTGDLTVSGTTTTVSSSTLTIGDTLIKLGQAYTGSAYDQGIIFTRGDGSSSNTQNTAMLWDESEDEFVFAATNTEAGTTSGNVTLDDLANLHVGKITADDTSVFSGSIELGHATDTTIARASSGAITVEGTAVLLAGAQTGITTILNASTKIGRDSDNLVDFATTDNKIIFRVEGVNEVELVQNALSPVTNDGVALGTTSLGWSDLHIAAQGVINWANGEMTITEGDANTLTVAGGTFATAALTTSTIVASGIVKTDDTTNATSTTDGSLQTDGGLSVVLDAVFGDDVKLLSDSAVLSFGADSEASITHADDAGLTFNSDITMAADKSINLPQGANVKFTDPITQDSIDDHDAQGIIMTFTAGSTITPFSPVYLHTDDEVHEADADGIATMPCIGVSINTSNVTDGNSVEVMVLGLIRDESFTDFGTNGAPVYVSTTVGTMTNTAPSGTNDVVQVIGHSIGEKLLFVQPCLTTIEHA